MRCAECRAEFDEMNESQPVCPGCGNDLSAASQSIDRFDDDMIAAAMDDAHAMINGASETDGLDLEPELDDGPCNSELPSDLLEARDEADSLLEACGFASYHLPEGSKIFKLPERIM